MIYFSIHKHTQRKTGRKSHAGNAIGGKESNVYPLQIIFFYKRMLIDQQ